MMLPILTDQRALLPFMDLGAIAPGDFVAWYNDQRQEIDKVLLDKGVVKFHGVQIASAEDFQNICDAIGSKFLSYIDGNSPRIKLSGNVYTSTEYDPAQRITMHNELSYSAKWPGRLFFSCIQPALTGGETLLADSREILRQMDPAIVDEIEKRGITYIRNLHSGEGMGPSWQDTFETTSKEQLERYCRQYNIAFEWTANGHLRLLQSAVGISTHRQTGERIWFNQIDQFHPSHLGEEMYETMGIIYGTPDQFPMYVRYGDGKDISESVVLDILHTIETVTIAPVWEKHELLIVDNELVAHGRNSYTGERKVLVAMSE